MPDYKQMLIDYMRHVGDCEGTYFLYADFGSDLTEKQLEPLKKFFQENEEEIRGN